MEKIDIVLTVVTAGFGLILSLMLIVWNSLNTKIDNLDKNLGNRIDKLDEKVTDIDRRLCRLEGAFSSKECCMIKDSSQIKKAE